MLKKPKAVAKRTTTKQTQKKTSNRKCATTKKSGKEPCIYTDKKGRYFVEIK